MMRVVIRKPASLSTIARTMLGDVLGESIFVSRVITNLQVLFYVYFRLLMRLKGNFRLLEKRMMQCPWLVF